MRLIFLFKIVFFSLLLTACNELRRDGADLIQLSEEFQHPPMSSRPGAFWCWLNGDVTKPSITHDLEEMKAKGMSRAEIWDVAAVYNPEGAYGVGPQFLGDESVDLIKHALSEGRRLGMRIGMVGSSGWNAGGSWVKPDWASKALYISDTKLSGKGKLSVKLPFPTVPDNCPKDASGMPVFYKEVAVLAIPDNDEKAIKSIDDIIILSKYFDGESLQWDVPEGDWRILRFVCSNTGQTLIVPSPKSNGLFIDFLDPEATKKHLAYMLNRLGITLENADECGLSYIEFDSMELDPATPWTDSMDSIFKADHGFDITPFLAVFAGWKLPGGNDDFRYKFKKTISDRLILSHYVTGRNFLKQYGIDLVAEAGGPGPPIWGTCPVDALKALGSVSIPRGEFWVRHRNMFLIKEVSSASHIYGINSVDAESFTTWRRWKDAPHDLKKYVDRAFCEGLNTVTIHTFANTRPEHGLPGRTYHAGMDINPATTWWEQARPFMDYLSRCSYMLKQGLFVADVAWYYGDKTPNFFPEFHDVPEKPGLEGLSPGNDFDVVNTDCILNRMRVEKGNIILPDGMSYKLLVIPDRQDIPAVVINKLKGMIDDGANILIQGESLAQELGERALTGSTIDEALENLMIIRDFSSESGELDYIHRDLGNADVYFVRNTTDHRINELCSFRSVQGKPQLWDPVTGKQFADLKFKRKNGMTHVPVVLAAHGSCFIVFSKRMMKIRSAGLPELYDLVLNNGITRRNLSGSWTLEFPPDRGAPHETSFKQLISWIDHPDQGIKYFSGTVSYKKTINVSDKILRENRAFYLDLGEVRDVAEIFINNYPAGILWTKPFITEISRFLKTGSNEIEVRVTNMWINRLTGDMALPADERYCKTNQPFIIKDNWAGGGDETYHLQDAGLLGPVQLVIRQ